MTLTICHEEGRWSGRHRSGGENFGDSIMHGLEIIAPKAQKKCKKIWCVNPKNQYPHTIMRGHFCFGPLLVLNFRTCTFNIDKSASACSGHNHWVNPWNRKSNLENLRRHCYHLLYYHYSLWAQNYFFNKQFISMIIPVKNKNQPSPISLLWRPMSPLKYLTVFTLSSSVAFSSQMNIVFGCSWKPLTGHMWLIPSSIAWCRANALCDPVISTSTCQ